MPESCDDRNCDHSLQAYGPQWLSEFRDSWPAFVLGDADLSKPCIQKKGINHSRDQGIMESQPTFARKGFSKTATHLTGELSTVIAWPISIIRVPSWFEKHS